MSATTLQLRQGIEVLRGMDDTPLIYDPVTGTYHRISRSAEALLSYFDGSRSTDDLVSMLARDDAQRAEQVRVQVSAFVDTLDRSGLLVGSDVPDDAGRRSRIQTSRVMPRVVVTRALPRVLEPLAGVVRATPQTAVATALALLAVAGFATGAGTLIGHDASVSPFALRDGLVGAAPVFGAALAVQLFAVLVHECAHALVAQVLKVPVRALGFAMLFYFMPVAYVDRTDAYRVRSRAGRLALALAGIVSDGIFCGATALVASNASGTVQQVALVLLAYQLLGLLFNVNPLLPTDGYVALEVSLGLVDLRGRAFALVTSLLRRRELPPYLARLGRPARIGYVLYAVFASAYVAVAAVSFLVGMAHSFHTVAAAVGQR
jgi:putative peptide zinc metalloprotease protein